MQWGFQRSLPSSKPHDQALLLFGSGVRGGAYLLLWGLFFSHALPAQSDTTLYLPTTTIREQRFVQTGYTAWRADSLPVQTPLSLAERLLWENTLTVRANAPGTLATLSARGAGPNRTPVFWNGLQLQSPMHGVVDAALLPLWPGDLLEVRYGGQSAAQSSGAMGGTVLVETGHIQAMGWSGQIGSAAGSFGAREVRAGLGYANQRWTTQARAIWQRADNDFPFKNIAQIGQPQVQQVSNRAENWNVQQFNRLIINEKNTLRTTFWQQKAFREIPPAMTEAPSETWQRDVASRAVATWEHRPNHRALWQTRAAWLDEAIYFRQFADTDTSRSRTALFSTEYTDRWRGKLIWKIGTSALRQWAQADGYMDSTQWYGQTRLAAFGMAERAWGSGRLSALLRQEWAVHQAAPFTWSLGGEQRLGKAGLLRGHVSRNFNLPTFNDRFWAALGQPDLRPERGYSADAGWTLQRKTFSTELTGFQIYIHDWILWQPGSNGLFRPGNLRKVWSRGLEAAAHGQGKVGLWRWKLSARVQWSKTTQLAVYGGSVADPGKQLPYTPQQAGSLALRVHCGAFSGGYLHQFTGGRFATTDNSQLLPRFQTGQLLLQYGWKLGKGRPALTLDLRVENVWNTPYQILAFRPMPGRNGRVGLGVAW